MNITELWKKNTNETKKKYSRNLLIYLLYVTYIHLENDRTQTIHECKYDIMYVPGPGRRNNFRRVGYVPTILWQLFFYGSVLGSFLIKWRSEKIKT